MIASNRGNLAIKRRSKKAIAQAAMRQAQDIMNRVLWQIIQENGDGEQGPVTIKVDKSAIDEVPKRFALTLHYDEEPDIFGICATEQPEESKLILPPDNIVT